MDDRTITLAPHSGVQFLELSLDFARVARFSRDFVERPDKVALGAEQRTTLLGLWNEDEPDGEPALLPESGDDEYSLGKEKAVEPFLGKWLPVPYLRLLPGIDAYGREAFEKGPTNWARIRITPAATAQGAARYVVMFAFDTEPVERRPNRPDTGPTRADIESPREFCFVSRMSQLGWFVSDPQIDAETGDRTDFQEWIAEWIESAFHGFCQTQAKARGRVFKPEDLEHKLEHFARYFALLDLIQRHATPPSVKFIDTLSAENAAQPVNVDLLLDIGNSRTCGMLIETYPNDSNVDLNNAQVLRLRDLSQPERLYADPFESHVQLAQANFGREDLSRKSGRTQSFFWPSLVRVGPEAVRYREQAEGTEAIGGLSSPKRYLWDMAAVNQEWRFPAGDYSRDGVGPPVERAARRYLNAMGDAISLVKNRKRWAHLFRRDRVRPGEDPEKPAQKITFSRSSFYGLMTAEIVAQALSMINDWSVRKSRQQRDLPRRLTRIIVTLPPGTPVREQEIMRARTEGAIELIWDLMGWSKPRAEGLPLTVPRPHIEIAWDEATCVQLVWLYGEIAQKFGGRFEAFFDLWGRLRPFVEAGQPVVGTPERSLRVASVDIGGGTTDLVVTTYHVENDRALKPILNFRETFRIAGDDILKAVIENCVLPDLQNALQASGMRHVPDFLRERFGGDRAGLSEQEKHLRREFSSRVLTPIGLGLLGLWEESGDSAQTETRKLRDFFSAARPLPDRRILAYLDGPAHHGGATGFTLDDTDIIFDPQRLTNAVNATLRLVFDNLADAIRHFEPDLVLMSGRPSRLPAVVDMLRNRMPVPPDRLLPLHQYKAGTWYPFRRSDNARIADPKTAAVVGCMLCALSQRQLTNFALFTDRIRMRSTSKFVGPLERDGVLLDKNIKFRPEDFADPTRVGQPKDMPFYTRTYLGARQIESERWVTTQLYHLAIQPQASGGGDFARPITVSLKRDTPDETGDKLDQHAIAEAKREDITIDGAIDHDGMDARRSMILSFNTLSAEDGYWLDTGILKID